MLNIRKWLNHAAQLLPYDNAYQEAVYLAKKDILINFLEALIHHIQDEA